MIFDEEIEVKDSLARLRVSLLTTQRIGAGFKTSFEKCKQIVFDMRRERLQLKFKMHNLKTNYSTKETVTIEELCAELV